jgi:hypothetical protein
VTRDAFARRLLARLVDEHAIETEPIADVRTELAALGLDSTRAIALARRLAAGTPSPAVRLLGRIGGAEESDDEIRRLEQADIAALRRDLAGGATAVAIANAQRAAGGQSTVVAMRRRRPRRLFYGLGSVAVALAASILFYVGLSTDRFQYSDRDKVSPSGTATETATPAQDDIGYLRAPATPAAEPSSPQESTSTEVAGADSPAEPAPETDGEAAGSLQSQSVAGTSASPGEQSATAPSSQIAVGPGLADSARPEENGQEAGRGLQALNQPAASTTPLPTVLPDDASAAAKSKTDADAAQERRRADELEGLNQFRVDPSEQQAAQGESTSSPATAPDQAEEKKMTRDELAAALKQKGNAGSSSAVSKQQAPAQQQPASETADVAAAPKKQEAAKSNQQTQTLSAAAPSRAMSTKPSPFGLTVPVVGLLIVDPELVPADVRQKDYPKGDLPARLADARRSAGDRQVAALVKLRLADRLADAVIVAGAKRGLSVQNNTDFVESAAPVVMPSLDEPYDLIPLERR